MLSKTLKITLLIAMSLVALSVEIIIPFVCLSSHTQNIAHFLYNTGITRYGWILVFILAGTSIFLTKKWRPGNAVFRATIIFISIIAIILAALWFFALCFISSNIWALIVSSQYYG